MLNNHTCNTRIAAFARYEFLDLCILGETGTGKTHAAKLIHKQSSRSRQPFVAVNCAELTPSIIESELFGFEKGAFTGATETRAGKFEAAAGGTLFLDEIGELPLNLQAKLLKVVEEKCVTRVGGTRPHAVDVRIIYATHRRLDCLREDLRYRIAAHTIYLAPLRERHAEIVPLARQFVNEFEKKSGRTIIAEPETLEVLKTAEWRGNVRQLRSFIEEACLEAFIIADADCIAGTPADSAVKITVEFLRARLEPNAKPPEAANRTADFRDNDDLPPFAPGAKLESYLGEIENRLLKNALRTHNNNQTHAARELGISRSGLIKKLKRISH